MHLDLIALHGTNYFVRKKGTYSEISCWNSKLGPVSMKTKKLFNRVKFIEDWNSYKAALTTQNTESRSDGVTELSPIIYPENKEKTK